jgi:hypothetical protein
MNRPLINPSAIYSNAIYLPSGKPYATAAELALRDLWVKEKRATPAVYWVVNIADNAPKNRPRTNYEAVCAAVQKRKDREFTNGDIAVLLPKMKTSEIQAALTKMKQAGLVTSEKRNIGGVNFAIYRAVAEGGV